MSKYFFPSVGFVSIFYYIAYSYLFYFVDFVYEIVLFIDILKALCIYFKLIFFGNMDDWMTRVLFGSFEFVSVNFERKYVTDISLLLNLEI